MPSCIFCEADGGGGEDLGDNEYLHSLPGPLILVLLNFL